MTLQTIAEHYGLDNQLLQAMEECGELIQAISKYKRYKDKLRLIEEIADVQIMINQLVYLLGCEDRVNEMMIIKLKRQTERIKEELSNVK